MNKQEMERKAQDIISSLDSEDKDGGLCFADLSNAYLSIVKLAEDYEQGLRYEYEAKLDALTEQAAWKPANQ